MLPAAVLALALAAPASGAPAPAAPASGAPPAAEGAAARGAPAPERLVDEVVAVVRNPPSAPPRVITLSKLEEEARIVLVSRGATGAAAGALDRAALRAALEWLLDQTLVADEASRLRLDALDRGEVLGELRRFQDRFPSFAEYERFLDRIELTEDELLATLGRMLRVQRYVQSRVGRGARVAEDEVDRWLEARGAGEASPAARDAARAQIAEERAASQVKGLLAELRSRAEIRVVGHLRGPEGS